MRIACLALLAACSSSDITAAPDGSTKSPDGAVTHIPDGSVTHTPDGAVAHPDGAVAHPDGSVAHTPDGAVAHTPDAAVTQAPDAGSVRAGPGIRPTAGNTGVPPGVTLTEIDDDVVITDDNTTLDAKDIHGFLTIQASHVRVTRSIVRGHAVMNNRSIISVDSGTDITIEDCEIAVDAPSATVDGFGGEGMTVSRMNIHGGVDGMKVRSNSTVQYSYIHDMMSFDHDPNQGGGPTHNDAIQILEGTNIHIVGNSLVASMSQNSAIQITQDFGMVGNVHIEDNFADGGGCTFNFAHKGGDSLTDLFTVDNRFGRNSFFDCPILKSTKTTLSSSGDAWDDDGTPVPIQTHD